jgi:hypothetical protein
MVVGDRPRLAAQLRCIKIFDLVGAGVEQVQAVE